jgi:hypothetical protein
MPKYTIHFCWEGNVELNARNEQEALEQVRHCNVKSLVDEAVEYDEFTCTSMNVVEGTIEDWLRTQQQV